MITSIDVKQNEDKTTHVTYSVVFNGAGHSCWGSFDATADEATTAFTQATVNDMWAGFKKLVLTRLKDEAMSALGGGDGE